MSGVQCRRKHTFVWQLMANTNENIYKPGHSEFKILKKKQKNKINIIQARRLFTWSQNIC